jgi:hypothetical protein
MGSTNSPEDMKKGGLWTDSFGRVGATLSAMEKAGWTSDDLTRLRRSSVAAHKALLAARGVVEPISERLARRIMGDNFFGSIAWADSYRTTLSGRQQKKIANFPWSEEVLDSECPLNPGKTVSQTHFAFLGMSSLLGGEQLTIARWQVIHPADSQPRFYSYPSDTWFANEDFILSSTCDLRWYLALKEIVPNSTSKRWENMLGMLPSEYETASSIAETTKVLLYRRKNNVYLNRNVYAACDTLVSVGHRVVVGFCLDHAVSVSSWNGNPSSGVGLSAFRKLGL